MSLLDWLYARIDRAVTPYRQRYLRRRYAAWVASLPRPVQTRSSATTVTYLAGWQTRVYAGRGWVDLPSETLG